MRRALILALSLAFTGPSFGGGVDSPLPELVTGQTTYHLFTVPGVTSNSYFSTLFSCTSLDTVSMQVGVELFAGPGGGATNDAVATSLSIAPGATKVFGSGVAAGFTVHSNVGGLGHTGSARILATSKKLACTAFTVDSINDPPTSSWHLTIIGKTKQKAFN